MGMGGERTWRLVALGGVLLALVLALVVFAKRRRGWEERPVITGADAGAHLLLHVDGLGPRRVPLGSRFELRARALVQGEPAVHVARLDDLRVRLVVPEHLLVVEGKPQQHVALDEQGRALLRWMLEARAPGGSPLIVHAASKRLGAASTWRLAVAVDSATAEPRPARPGEEGALPEPQTGMTLSMAVQTEGPQRVPRNQAFELAVLVVNPGLAPGSALDLTDLKVEVEVGPGLVLLDERTRLRSAAELVAGNTHVFPVHLIGEREGRVEVRATAVASGGRARAMGIFHVVVE